MDALSDPRAYLSAQEKRAEQLKAIGVDENDIANDVILSDKKKATSTGLPSIQGSIPGIPTKKPQEKGIWNAQKAALSLIVLFCP